MNTSDIQFEVMAPARWDRLQVFLRLAVLALLGVVSARAGWAFAIFYWGLPIVAAVSIGQHGAREYPEKNGRWVLRVLHWWSAFVAYMLFVSDRFPSSTEELERVRFALTPSGNVDAVHALLRLLTSLPELVVLVVLGWVASLLAVAGGVCVLFSERVPAAVLRFQRYYTALQARWLAYHASLVDAHPLLDVPRYQTR